MTIYQFTRFDMFLMWEQGIHHLFAMWYHLLLVFVFRMSHYYTISHSLIVLLYSVTFCCSFRGRRWQMYCMYIVWLKKLVNCCKIYSWNSFESMQGFPNYVLMVLITFVSWYILMYYTSLLGVCSCFPSVFQTRKHIFIQHTYYIMLFM